MGTSHERVRKTCPVQIGVALRAAEYRTFVSAARYLVRIMGTQAPDLPKLLRVQLGGRGPAEIADEYLDSVAWPQGRANGLGPPV